MSDLIRRGLITSGTVDERSITDLTPGNLKHYKRVHLFAGIGGWDYALRLAGWPEDRPVWTGSCPCQPFSIAGDGRGVRDERHLWPEMLRLLAKRRPPTVFGEQVASPDGRLWLSGVRADLEALGYEVGAADLCAAGVGSPHIRQRLYWVAWLGDSAVSGLEGRRSSGCGCPGERNPEPSGHWDQTDTILCGDGETRRIESGLEPLVDGVPERVAPIRGYGNAIVPPLAATFIRAFLETGR